LSNSSDIKHVVKFEKVGN